MSQRCLQAFEKGGDVVMGGIMIEYRLEHPFVTAIVNDRQHTVGSLVELIGCHAARKRLQRPVQQGAVHLAVGLFFPRLDPVLHGAEGHKHAVITLQVPTGGAIRQAVFHDDAHRQVDDSTGVMTAGPGQSGEIGVEMLAAVGAGGG